MIKWLKYSSLTLKNASYLLIIFFNLIYEFKKVFFFYVPLWFVHAAQRWEEKKIEKNADSDNSVKTKSVNNAVETPEQSKLNRKQRKQAKKEALARLTK